MQILTNVSKAELAYLTNQPTAKAMIEKNKSEAINIQKGDAKGAAEFVAKRMAEKQQDSVQISAEGLEALQKTLLSKNKGVKITQNGSSYNILFKNPAFAYGAVRYGYIDIDGEKFVLSEKDKAELKKAADESFNQMQRDTLTAAIEHDAHVYKQQAEAIRDAGKEEMDFLEMLLENIDNEEEEWISPLTQLENRSVSMDLEKTSEGFIVKGINTTKGYTF